MNSTQPFQRNALALAVTFALSVVIVTAQTRNTLRGSITDELGAAIVGASLTLTDASGVQKKATTNDEGVYTFSGLAPGKYQLQAVAPGFTPSDKEVEITGARQSVDLTLKITIEERVTVGDAPVSTEAGNNANQTVIAGRDLDALPDDPNELAAALQALAGPSVGPNGGQIFIDGFTGGNLPSKDSIREIRINQNPFAAENDQPSARIDVLTRPGTDKFRGGASLNFNDESLNSRNPFAISSSKRTPFQIRQYDMNLSGPIVSKKASFFFSIGRVETDDNELVRATVIDDALNVAQFGQAFLVPRRSFSFSPRFDYAINTNHTLVVRYNFNRFRVENQGVGGFNLPERGFNTISTNQTVQVTENAILNATTINETRFQYSHGRSEQTGNNSVPALDVSGSFGAGGSQVGNSFNERTTLELNNFTARQQGKHTIKFGARVRYVKLEDTSQSNFGGTWSFTGGFGLTSVERYQLTLQMQQQGFTPAEIRAAGGGATAFSLNAGNPFADVSRTDYGVFAQDDWRIRPNLTLSYGLRYEYQTNADSKFDFAPRLAVAWSPGAVSSNQPPKMVIRIGTGFFFNRFSEGFTLQSRRFNGVNLIQTSVTEPTGGNPPTVAEQQAPNVAPIYSVLNQWSPTSVPPVGGLPTTQQTIWQVDPNLQIPTVFAVGSQVERKLPRNITVFVGFYNIRMFHVIRARDVNAPLPGTITELTPNGIRPDPTTGEINRYEASGQFNQRHLFVGFNKRLSRSITLNAHYSLSKSTNDTDGQGSGLFPMNSYDLSGEFGRGSSDIRHRFTIFGTVTLPWWRLVLNPFVIANTGPPFNITTGQDRNLDRQFNERPSFAGPNADCSSPVIRCTRFGNFNLAPLPGETIVPRNYGQAPGAFVINLRVSRSFAFMDKGNSAASRLAATGSSAPAAPTRAAARTEKRFNLNVSINFQNLLNHVNLSTPVGNLASPSFGQSLGLGGVFGSGSTGAGNRRISAQLRLSF